ncbi:MAG: DUF2062 domain-containing protein [Planctomycetota bacterium]
MRNLWKKTRLFVVTHILHADDTPHRLALGAAIAVFVAMTPTIPFHTVLAITLAAVFGANKAICVPVVWVVNPVTIVPLYGLCWKVGQALTMSPVAGNGGHPARVLTRVTGHVDQGIWSRLFEAEFWTQLLRMMLDLGVELWVGCLVVGAAGGLITYFVIRWGVTEYRQRRRVLRISRNIHRARLRQAKHRNRTRANRVPVSPEST